MRTRGVLAGVGLLGLVAGEAWRSRRLVDELHAAQDQAMHDELTGLLNRSGMGRAVERALAEHGQAALLLVDLHGFKAVNDEYGHLAGDEVLVEVGRRITEVLVDEELAGRHGGDEFGVLTLARPEPWVRSRVAAIAAAVRGPLTLRGGGEVMVRASVGAAVAADALELWESADRAERAAKRQYHHRSGVGVTGGRA